MMGSPLSCHLMEHDEDWQTNVTVILTGRLENFLSLFNKTDLEGKNDCC